jgi:hypothetical protein
MSWCIGVVARTDLISASLQVLGTVEAFQVGSLSAIQSTKG